MNKTIFTTFSLLFFFSISFGQQKDTIYGKIKTIREKVEFLTEKENPQFLYYNDYGHSGFMGPEPTISRFKRTWCSTNFCYYINYERRFNENGLLIEDIWFDKKDSLKNYYRYEYNKKERLVRKIDSLGDLVYTDNHYYEGYRNETVISQNSDLDYFNYTYMRYDEKGKLIRQKKIDEYGTVNEYVFKYNENGKLLFRIYKNPNSWKQKNERTWSYGPQDSIRNTYKDLINKYDGSNRLIQRQRYDLYEDNKNHKNPKLVENTFYEYDKNNNLTLIKHINGYIKVKPTFNHYVYDKENRLIKKYCCSEMESDAKRIEKYNFKNNEIKSLKYTKKSWPSKEIKTYKVNFDYKYDDKGNWIEIVKKVDGIELYKWIRKIEYYK